MGVLGSSSDSNRLNIEAGAVEVGQQAELEAECVQVALETFFLIRCFLSPL
jgi:hypothetical protein